MPGTKGDEKHMWHNGVCRICATQDDWGLAREACVSVSLTPGEYKIAKAMHHRDMVLDAAE